MKKIKLHAEKIQPGASESFVMRSFDLPVFDHPFHQHPEIEITYIGRSRGTRVIGDHVGSFAEGELYVLGPRLPHVFRNTSLPAAGAFARVLHFDPDLWNGLLEEIPELARFREMLDGARRGVVYKGRIAREAGRLLEKLQAAAGAARLALFFDLAELLAAAPPSMPLASPGYTGEASGIMDDRVQTACRTILDHFDTELRMADSAKKAGLTPGAFSRLFQRGTRKTFQQFVLDVRLGHACRLLAESDLPILEIAFASGFRNLSNFNRQFRKAYSQTPRSYRVLQRISR